MTGVNSEKMDFYSMNSLLRALLFLLAILLSPQVMANVFNTIVNIQCNECDSNQAYHRAALSALKDREQKVVNVVNFNQFDVRKFDVKKLQVEVCSDYWKSATKGYCKMEDGSSIKPLKVTNIEREKVILLSEQLYQLDFFQRQKIQADPKVANTAWELAQNHYVANKLMSNWQQEYQYEYSAFLAKWQQGERASLQANIPLKNLSPPIVITFADGSEVFAEVDFIDSNNQQHFSFTQLKDANSNHLVLAREKLFTLGDKFQFESQQNNDFIKMKELVELSGFMVEVQETLTGISASVVSCSPNENAC
ncbi:hypothetical protein L2735_05215 [Shewanella olleyana]|uniref:hypothetical protein n=1 Tax=Shewanella olleyana TaxID=135626 RepID=UPI00200BB68B|nr:hypothetical protein [Shewanella olleyana]MCL1066206.1 hypothetical protein [Shewanella olleyana]